jgi:hypothetical protein
MLDSVPISLAIVHAAARLVPRSRREDWRAEWIAELRAVCRAYGIAWSSTEPHERPEVTSFCLGAFEDALMLRVHAIRCAAKDRLHAGAPCRVILLQGSFLVASLLLCLARPVVREAAFGRSHLPADQLVLISTEGQFSAEHPTVRFAEFALVEGGGWTAVPRPRLLEACCRGGAI